MLDLSPVPGPVPPSAAGARAHIEDWFGGTHRTATKQVHHPLVGDMTLAFEMLELPADPGLSVLIYSAVPGSPSEESLRELARWSETRTKLSAARAGSET